MGSLPRIHAGVGAHRMRRVGWQGFARNVSREGVQVQPLHRHVSGKVDALPLGMRPERATSSGAHEDAAARLKQNGEEGVRVVAACFQSRQIFVIGDRNCQYISRILHVRKGCCIQGDLQSIPARTGKALALLQGLMLTVPEMLLAATSK